MNPPPRPSKTLGPGAMGPPSTLGVTVPEALPTGVPIAPGGGGIGGPRFGLSEVGGGQTG